MNIIYSSNLTKINHEIPLPEQPIITAPFISNPEEIIVMNGANFTLCTTSNGILKESLYLSQNDWWNQSMAKVKKFVNISDLTLIVGNPGYGNYYHWVYQIFASILFIKNFKQESRLQILGPTLNSWRKRFISLIGDNINYIEADVNTTYFLNNGYYTDVMWGKYSFNPNKTIINIFNSFSKNFNQQVPDKIYISRRDTIKRSINNESEVEKHLEKQGFVIIEMSKLSIEEQIAHIQGAHFVIAPHGAGLVNLVFGGEKRKKIIELLSEDYINQCFRTIAAVKNYEYFGIINQAIIDPRGHHHTKINVDISLLNKVIEDSAIKTT